MGKIWFVAAAITLGFMVAEYAPGRLATLYADTLGPLLASAWLSYVCHRWWSRNQTRILAMPPRRLQVILALSVGLLMLGGIRLLWVDPWLFAPMLWPLVEIWRALGRGARPEAGADAGAAGSVGSAPSAE